MGFETAVWKLPTPANPEQQTEATPGGVWQTWLADQSQADMTLAALAFIRYGELETANALHAQTAAEAVQASGHRPVLAWQRGMVQRREQSLTAALTAEVTALQSQEQVDFYVADTNLEHFSGVKAKGPHPLSRRFHMWFVTYVDS